jgi:histidinol-phosphate aminotransferase
VVTKALRFAYLCSFKTAQINERTNMALELTKLVRPHLLKLKPYSSARDEFKGKADVYIDANENPYGSVGDGNYNRYPDPLQLKLKEEIVKLKGAKVSQLFLGNGSDEPIDLLIRIFCTPGVDTVLQMPPTYGMYQVSADINGVQVINVPLTEDFQIKKKEVIEALTPQTKLVFICSPNNPTGNSMDKDTIIAILKKAPGLVVIDEAYIDFSNSPSFISELDKYPNLVILQTFSKAWGLAGIRLGMAFASEEVIGILNKVKYPYNVNQVTQQIVLKALLKPAQKDKMVAKILREREWLIEHFGNAQYVTKVYPTDANFILVKTTKGKAIYDKLVEDGIVVRDRSAIALCEGCLRVTVGTEGENLALMRVWETLQL